MMSKGRLGQGSHQFLYVNRRAGITSSDTMSKTSNLTKGALSGDAMHMSCGPMALSVMLDGELTGKL